MQLSVTWSCGIISIFSNHFGRIDATFFRYTLKPRITLGLFYIYNRYIHLRSLPKIPTKKEALFLSFFFPVYKLVGKITYSKLVVLDINDLSADGTLRTKISPLCRIGAESDKRVAPRKSSATRKGVSSYGNSVGIATYWKKKFLGAIWHF